MQYDNWQTIDVPLVDGNTVHMVPNGYASMNRTVVFADPEKIAPYIIKFNKSRDPLHGERKRDRLRKHLSYAISGASSKGVCEPLQLPDVSCDLRDDAVEFTIRNGLTRMTELLIRRAEFIPLEITSRDAEALHTLVGGKLPPRPVKEYSAGASSHVQRAARKTTGSPSQNNPAL